jgi:ribonuclease G
MSKGAYLIIEHTEALHVIDVNSGNRSNKASNQEDNGGQHDCRCRNR